MVTSARYFDLVREMKNAYNHRLRLVESAQQSGMKPTARLFATTLPTVRKWLRRYQQLGPRGWPNGPAPGMAKLIRLPLTAKRNCSNFAKRCPPLPPAACEFDLRI